MTDNWPDCGNGWIVSHHVGHVWSITCSGSCRCRWIPDEATSVTFLLPRPLADPEHVPTSEGKWLA